jgi:hypothetical protein
MNPSWHVLEMEVPHGPALEIRAQPKSGGGWHIRAERTTGRAHAVSLCWLTATAPEYGITLLHS